MPPPLQDGAGRPTTDGSPQTVEQYSKDVAAFLMWAAEPHLEARKRIGFQVMIFLIVFAGLLYFTKKKVWSDGALSAHRDDRCLTTGPHGLSKLGALCVCRACRNAERP